jgi:N-acetylmuramoyl-L-alanine amidase
MKSDSAHVQALYPSANFGERRQGCRPRLLILHYTGMPCAERAIQWLAHPDSNVSCHYVIDETGFITQMVEEKARAWHAGVSHWHGERDINSVSIGIEIQNAGHSDGYPEFPREQMVAVAALARDIVERNGIAPEGVLAHSDVAPGRKIDPGEKFDWAWLAEAGVGHWITPSPVNCSQRGLGPGERSREVAEMQMLLRRYGYDLEPHGLLDERTSTVVHAFQLHFRQQRADGRIDQSTLDTLSRLVAALPATVTS